VTTIGEITRTVSDIMTKLNIHMKNILEAGYSVERMLDFMKVFNQDIEKQVKQAITIKPILSNNDDKMVVEESGAILKDFRDEWNKSMIEC
jgi:hypothetical protein